MAKVSICIPAYLQTTFLTKTLDSILVQDYKDFEVIITDDSPDDTVKKLVERYDFGGRLRYIKNQVRKGTPANWNEAISFATGDYIKIMHHDDWFTQSSSLQEFVDLLDRNPKADFAFSGYNVIAGDFKYYGFIGSQRSKQFKNDPYLLLLGNYVGVPSVTIFKRNYIGTFDESLKWLVDVDFYVQCFENNPDFVAKDKALINMCNSEDHQVTKECKNNMEIEIREYIYLYQKYNERINLNKKHVARLQNLFIKYNIMSFSKLKSIHLISDIPVVVKNQFVLHKILKMRIVRILRFLFNWIKQIVIRILFN